MTLFGEYRIFPHGLQGCELLEKYESSIFWSEIGAKTVPF